MKPKTKPLSWSRLKAKVEKRNKKILTASKIARLKLVGAAK